MARTHPRNRRSRSQWCLSSEKIQDPCLLFCVLNTVHLKGEGKEKSMHSKKGEIKFRKKWESNTQCKVLRLEQIEKAGKRMSEKRIDREEWVEVSEWVLFVAGKGTEIGTQHWLTLLVFFFLFFSFLLFSFLFFSFLFFSRGSLKKTIYFWCTNK